MSLLPMLLRQKAAMDAEFLTVIDQVDAQAHAAERHALIRLMNHIHVVDRIFDGHLRGVPHGYASTNTPETPTLEALADAMQSVDHGYLELAQLQTKP